MVSTVLPRVVRPSSADELTLADVEAVRLLLRGESVIDWHRLNYADHSEVDRFHDAATKRSASSVFSPLLHRYAVSGPPRTAL